jgi:hypothetical protein
MWTVVRVSGASPVMKKSLAVLFAAAAVGVLALPAAAKTDKKVSVRWAHTYASAIDEAKERGCVVVATFHAEH